MADYFGYNKDTNVGGIASSSMVLVQIEGSGVKLVQSCNITYQRTVEPKYELGSDSVWMATGQSTGSCDLTRIVGVAPLLAPYKPSGSCTTTNINVAKGNSTCSAAAGMITCSNCMLVRIGMTATAGTTNVTDNASYNIGSLSI